MTPYVVLAHDALAGVSAGATVPLDDDVHHHLVRVRRQVDGGPVTATDGTGREVDAVLRGATLVVEAVRRSPPPRPSIEVWQALGKQRKHDDVVRMLTEAGVDVVTAVTTERTQVDLAGKVARVRARWQAVADAACSQSRRPHRPAVGGPVALAELSGAGFSDTAVLVADPTATRSPLDALDARYGTASRDGPGSLERVVVVIGPEGGLTDDEVAGLVAAGASTVSLGPTVLRTEHAALVLASVVAAGLGRMG